MTTMATPKFGKVVRNGQVAVLYSPGFGAGWYSWNKEYPECLFDPEVVAMVEAKQTPTKEWCTGRYGDGFYEGGAGDLEIEWLPEGTAFIVNEYDGSESIQTNEGTLWTTA